jgi:hypothetical protein
MFRNQSSADEIFQAMQNSLVKTAETQVREEDDNKIRVANAILNLDKLVDKLEKTGRFKAANIVTNMMTKLARDPSEAVVLLEEDDPEEKFQTQPPAAGEELLPKDIDPTALAPYLTEGKRDPFILSKLPVIRMIAAEVMRELDRILQSEEAGQMVVRQFEKELEEIHELARDGKTPGDVQLQKYKDFVDKAKKFLEADLPEGEEVEIGVDTGSVKDKSEIKKLLEVLKMFGFSKKDLSDNDDEPEEGSEDGVEGEIEQLRDLINDYKEMLGAVPDSKTETRVEGLEEKLQKLEDVKEAL